MYQAYTNPNIAMGDVTCGVIMTSRQRSGWPRCNNNGSGAQIRNAMAVRSARRYAGSSAFTSNTRTNDAMMNAPATRPVMYGYTTISVLQSSVCSLGYT